MIRDYITLALKNIRKRGLRSWLTMLGIFIGIAAVVSLISLGDALQQAITGQFATLDADKLIIENSGTGFGPPGSTVVNKLKEHDLRVIRTVSGVREVIPRLIRIVKVEFNKLLDFSYIASIPEDKGQTEIIYDSLNIELEEGRLLESNDNSKVVLGNDFTDNRYGKKVRIGSVLNIQGKEFEVVGILKKASTFTINSVVLMVESDLKDILDIDDEIDLIVVQVMNKDEISTVAEKISLALRRDRNLKEGEDDFSVQTPVQSVDTINTILGVIRIVITGIASISLLIGGIGIANTMFTSVLERRREIGVMKAIGARNRDILSIFLFEAAFLGLVGGIVGAIIGLSLAFMVSGAASSFLGIEFNVSVSFPLILFSLSFSLLIGILSGIIPAYQASKLNPIEALRKWFQIISK
mgnify:CR=1 FL=1